MFGLEEVDVRLWDYFQCKKYGSDHLDNRLDDQLQSLNIIQGQDMLLEEKARRSLLLEALLMLLLAFIYQGFKASVHSTVGACQVALSSLGQLNW